MRNNLDTSNPENAVKQKQIQRNFQLSSLEAYILKHTNTIHNIFRAIKFLNKSKNIMSVTR